MTCLLPSNEETNLKSNSLEYFRNVRFQFNSINRNRLNWSLFAREHVQLSTNLYELIVFYYYSRISQQIKTDDDLELFLFLTRIWRLFFPTRSDENVLMSLSFLPNWNSSRCSTKKTWKEVLVNHLRQQDSIWIEKFMA